ncbi:MAG: polysaccharide biosynthesis protein, partial [Selenomonadaceae bacterium]
LIQQLPALIFIRLAFLQYFKLYTRIWRYASIGELAAIVISLCISSAIWSGYLILIDVMVPRSIQILSLLLTILCVGISRFSLRCYLQFILKIQSNHNGDSSQHNVLIVGAGDAGAVIAREINEYHTGNRTIVGFIDDSPKKKGQVLLGKKVLGSRDDIEHLTKELDVKEIIIAMPSVKGHIIREIISLCKKTKCELKILPGVYEFIDGNMNITQLRPVKIEDLLGRNPVTLDKEAVSIYLNNKTVLITGAGGSIGSEICRQIAKMGPRKLLLLGKGENSIYEINNELSLTYPEIKKVPIIADIRDRERIRDILSYFKPQVIFHAAAHKHVPLMEWQPTEAVRNNVFGTKVIAEEADRANVETFVMISTDKAVNPTNVMGCTKRIAEMFIQSMDQISKTRYVAVRFGNVLGSRGSVIPLFKKQILRGGPVTVTHPEMTRYFMTIPEASQLVLQAGAMAKGGEVFVLDMGDPVKIVDLAKDLITLSGYIPDIDIPIKFTGLRPGEKLYEELLSAEDGTQATAHKKIFTAQLKAV